MVSFDEEKPTSHDEKKPQVEIEDFQLGVWHLRMEKEQLWNARKHWDSLWQAVPLFYRLSLDIYTISPRLFSLYLLTQVWQGIEDALQMHFSTRLLRAVEAGVIQGKPDGKEIFISIFARLMCSAVVAYFHWHGKQILESLRTKVTRHFELHLLRGKNIVQGHAEGVHVVSPL